MMEEPARIVGFIGLGTMGASMARNIQRAGHTLVVSDVRREAADELVAGGARWATSPAEVAAQAEVIFTSLPGPREAEQVVLGPDGLLSAISAGKAYFDLSTNDMPLIKRMQEAFAQKRADMLDAPVSGGPQGARTGKLAIWVGGKRAVYDRNLAVLRSFADSPRYVGEIGAGTVAKLAHNCAGYIMFVGMAEVFAMGVKAGVDPLELWEAFRDGALGRVPVTDLLVAQFLPGKYSPPAFALKLAHKDVTLATNLARSLDVPMRLANMTLEEMTEALGKGWGELDSRSTMRLSLERAGVEIAIAPERLQAAVAARNATG